MDRPSSSCSSLELTLLISWVAGPRNHFCYIVLQIGLGAYVEAAVIAVLLVFNATLGFVQDGRATAALAALKKRLEPTALAPRDGAWIRLAASARQNLEAFCGVGPLDDLDCPLADFGERGVEFFAGIGAVGEDMAHPEEAVTDPRQHIGGAVAILDVGGMDDGADQEALGVGQDMALASIDFLAREERNPSGSLSCPAWQDRLEPERAGDRPR